MLAKDDEIKELHQSLVARDTDLENLRDETAEQLIGKDNKMTELNKEFSKQLLDLVYQNNVDKKQLIYKLKSKDKIISD